MGQAEAATVRKQFVVDAPIARAFAVFTDRFGDFKPPEHNMLGVGDRLGVPLRPVLVPEQHERAVGAEAGSRADAMQPDQREQFGELRLSRH
jgi:hypothetical protein